VSDLSSGGTVMHGRTRRFRWCTRHQFYEVNISSDACGSTMKLLRWCRFEGSTQVSDLYVRDNWDTTGGSQCKGSLSRSRSRLS